MSETKLLTLDEVAEIGKRANAATPGPWQARFIYRIFESARRDPVNLFGTKPDKDWSDSQFISRARTDIPALCATVRALEATLRWVETKLGQHHDLRTDLPLEQRLQAALHVICSRADGYKNYIETGKNAAARLRSELAAVTQENESLEADNKMLEGIGVERDLLQEQLVAVTEEREAEREDHQLTIDTFRQQEKIWQQQMAELRADIASLIEAKADEWDGEDTETVQRAKRNLCHELAKQIGETK